MSILCPTDFSHAAQEAANVAAALALKLSLPLRLVHCMDDLVAIGDMVVNVPDDKLLAEQLKGEAARLRQSGVVVTEEIRHGAVVWELIEAAGEQPTELMILGATGKGNAARWLIGSVAEAVAEEAPVPCLLVRRPEILMSWIRDHVELEALCAVDLAASSDTAISWLSTLASIGPAKIDAAYVHNIQDEGSMLEAFPARERDVSEKVRALAGDIPVKVHMLATTGGAAREFLKLAEDLSPGLVLVGSRHLHGLSRLMSRSFSRRVVTHARTNVLCAPARPKTSKGEALHINRVVVATDLGPQAPDMLRHARSLLPCGGDIHLLHVCHDPSPGINPAIASKVYFNHSLAAAKAQDEAAQQMMALSAASPDAGGHSLTSEILQCHDVADAICAAAERLGADVICMGSKGHSRMGVALLGSTVQRVLAQAKQPVFVITHTDTPYD